MSNLLFFSGGDFRGFSRSIISGDSLSSEVDFTRSSSATYFDSDGVLQTAATNEPRFHYLQDGSDRSGFLFEGAATNLIPYSNAISTTNGYTETNATLTEDFATAPDGTFTASRVEISATNGAIKKNYGTNNTDEHISLYVKSNTDANQTVQLFVGTGNGAPGLVEFTATTEWTRISSFQNHAGTNRIDFGSPDSGTDVLVWGAQSETTGFTTSFIYTDASTATRSADVATIDVSTKPWYNQNQGTMYIEWTDQVKATGGNAGVFALNDGTNNNRVQLFKDSSGARQLRVSSGGVSSVSGSVSQADYSATTHRDALAFNTDDFAYANDGDIDFTDSTVTVPTVTTLNIGAEIANNFLFGIISDLRYYDTRLADATLESLTVNNLFIALVNAGVLNSIVSYSRASTGTYFDSDGVLQTATANTPRIDYLQDGSGEFGLLIEGSATNLCLQSEVFQDNSYWLAGTNATVDANAAIAPDGNTTADRLTSDFNIGAQRREQTINVTSLTNKVFSLWVKEGTQNSNQPRIVISGDTDYQLSFTPTSDWVRYTVEVPDTDTSTSLLCRIYPTQSGGGLNGDNILVWGAQLEQNSFATSYIKTTTSTVTRSADVATLPLSLAPWFNALEGSVYMDWYDKIKTPVLVNQTLYTISDGTLGDRFEIFKKDFSDPADRVLRVVATSGTNISESIDQSNYSEGSQRSLFCYKSNDYAYAHNGSLLFTGGTGVPSTSLTTFEIGAELGGNQLRNTIKELRYYTKRKTNTFLEDITS